MSSLHLEGNCWKIQFQGADGGRRSLRIGRWRRSDATAIQRHVDALVAAAIGGQSLPRATAAWLGDVGPMLYDRMARVGLVEPREFASLGEFINGYIEGRKDVKATTRLTFDRARNHLAEHFGETRDLRTITAGDADDWWNWMTGERGLSKNTARKSVSIAKQFFAAARRKGLMDGDPLSHLSGFVRSNRERLRFIDLGTAASVMAACPDAEWRLLFALGRFGGLRIPSEVREFRWSDVDWERDRFAVHASKTEHHEDGGVRLVPIFAELHDLLRDAFERAEDGAEFVLPSLRHHTNPGVPLKRIVLRAGLTPWPKLWHNLRATRATELCEDYPAHVVAAWLGHTPQIASEHYLQVRDEHFARAAGKAVQNPVQQSTAGDCSEQKPAAGQSPEPVGASAVSGDVQSDAVACSGAENLPSGRYWT